MAEIMKQFVNLKDGIVFASHESTTEIDVEGDDIYQVEGKASDYLGMKYNNGIFTEAPIIRYAILDKHNTVVTINKTIFSSEVGSNIIIDDEDVEVLWTWNGTSFERPFEVGQQNLIFVDSVPVTTSTTVPAVSQESITALNQRHVEELEMLEQIQLEFKEEIDAKVAGGWVNPNIEAPVTESLDID